MEVKFLGHCLSQNKLLLDTRYHLIIAAICKGTGNHGNYWNYSFTKLPLEGGLHMSFVHCDNWHIVGSFTWEAGQDGKNKEMARAQWSGGWQCQGARQELAGVNPVCSMRHAVVVKTNVLGIMGGNNNNKTNKTTLTSRNKSLALFSPFWNYWLRQMLKSFSLDA